MKTFLEFLNESEDNVELKWVSFDELRKIFKASSTKDEFNTDKLKGTFPKLVDSKPFQNCEYCVALKGKDFYAGIAIGPRKGDEYGINKELPFVYELGSIQQGLGSALVKEAMKKFGTHIWFGVQDEDADEWWNKKAKNWGFTIKKIGMTGWDTPMYEFYAK